MTVYRARISQHMSAMDSQHRVVSVFAGTDSDHLAFAGTLTLRTQEAEDLVTLLDGEDRHVVSLWEDRFTIRHPLGCRPRLFECDAAVDYVPAEAVGRYVLNHDADGSWSLGEKLED